MEDIPLCKAVNNDQLCSAELHWLVAELFGPAVVTPEIRFIRTFLMLLTSISAVYSIGALAVEQMSGRQWMEEQVDDPIIQISVAPNTLWPAEPTSKQEHMYNHHHHHHHHCLRIHLFMGWEGMKCDKGC